MALVIFCVALVAAMRLRRSLSEAMSSQIFLFIRHARPRAGHPRLGRTPRTRSGRPGQARPRRPLGKRLGIILDRGLELASGVVVEVARVADGGEDLWVLLAQHAKEAVLEGAHALARQRVE